MNMLRTASLLGSVSLTLSLPVAAQVCRTDRLDWTDRQTSGLVGTAVAISADTIAAGGPGVDQATGGCGAVYVWRQQAGAWQLEQKITPPVPNANLTFGRALAIDGDRLVVGVNALLNAPTLFRRSAGQWQSAGPLVPTGFTYSIYFGHALAVDGEWIAVGAPRALGAPPLTVNTGAVHLFRDQGGVVTEVAQLRPTTMVTLDDIGIALAMEGAVLVVGTAVGSQSSTSLGRAFVYRIVNGQPGLEAELFPIGTAPGANSSGQTFGQVVATDGVSVAVADFADSSAWPVIGRVDVWRHQAGAWVHDGGVVPSSGCGFGTTVSIEGDDLIVGQACGDRIHHFRRTAGVWSLRHVTPSQPSPDVFQVKSMAIDAGLLALGSPLNLPPLDNAGQVAVNEIGVGSIPYGTGIAGSGGMVPALDGVGCPRIGQPYSVALSGGLGGSVAVLAIGDAPTMIGVFGGFLWTAPILLTVGAGLNGSPGAIGAGGFQVPIPLPSPAIAGVRLCFQAGVLDPAAVQSFALTNGLEIVVAL